VREKETDIYDKEAQCLKRSKDFIQKGGYEMEDLQLQFKSLVEHYEELFDQVKIITKISDRLQRKLDKTNDELELTNDQLNDRNVELQETIDALTKARIGRRAATLVLVVAVILFILSEAIIEPRIENWATDYYQESSMAFWIGLLLKFFIAVMIKPIEMLMERALTSRARKKAMKSSEAQPAK
jgi:hypothetical protein